jgi:hypothetical protein
MSHSKPTQTLFVFLAFILLFHDGASTQVKYFVVPLWQNGAPGFEARRNEPEISKDWWVRNIHNPSVMVYMPEM